MAQYGSKKRQSVNIVVYFIIYKYERHYNVCFEEKIIIIVITKNMWDIEHWFWITRSVRNIGNKQSCNEPLVINRVAIKHWQQNRVAMKHW